MNKEIAHSHKPPDILRSFAKSDIPVAGPNALSLVDCSRSQLESPGLASRAAAEILIQRSPQSTKWKFLSRRVARDEISHDTQQLFISQFEGPFDKLYLLTFYK
jgi:hypothetical protein